MALISLEDLDGLDDEQLDDDITDNPEPMDEEDSDRLLTHWQAVASTHQVSVPPGEGTGSRLKQKLFAEVRTESHPYLAGCLSSGQPTRR